MKIARFIFAGLLIALLVSMPVVADAHWGFGGGLVLGLGAGLITGFAFAPRPVYVAPPVYYAPPPAVYYPSYVPGPPPPGLTSDSYANSPGVSSANPPPAGQSRCREWRMINRHWESRWDSYYGRWQKVLVERWGWVGAPCSN